MTFERWTLLMQQSRMPSVYQRRKKTFSSGATELAIDFGLSFEKRIKVYVVHKRVLSTFSANFV